MKEVVIEKKKLNAQQEQIREQQKETWNAFAPGWKKWDDWVVTFMKPFAEEIIRPLKLKETDVVLDVATGTGEPGIRIASIVKKGKVTGQDISEKMLATAREKATKHGLSNYTTVNCDISELPFADNTFDAISCRFGYMFFPDMLMATKEMARVLKPGGRIATAVWGPPENNFWVTCIMAPLIKNLQLPQPPTGAPGMFRCAAPGLMTNLFKEAGLKNTNQTIVNNKAEMESFEFFWRQMNEVAAPIVAGMSKADDAMKEKIKSEVGEVFRKAYPAEPALMDSQALIIYGEK